jgi:hypothetical protein
VQKSQTATDRRPVYMGYIQERIKINLDTKKYINPIANEMKENPPVDKSKIKIEKLTPNQTIINNKTSEVQKIIENTDPDDVYIQRGTIVFDPETNVLKSRSKEVKLDTEKLMIP